MTSLQDLPKCARSEHASKLSNISQHHSDDPAELLRQSGWSVAVHNDYRLNGLAHTFWLWTHPNGRWIKGEGLTDKAALAECVAAHAAIEAKSVFDVSKVKQEIRRVLQHHNLTKVGDGVVEADLAALLDSYVTKRA